MGEAMPSLTLDLADATPDVGPVLPCSGMPRHPWVPQLQQPGVLCLTNMQSTQQSAGC